MLRQTATEVAKDLPLGCIKNEYLIRPLTNQEIEVVKRYVEICFCVSPADELNYDNAVRDLIKNGDIPHISLCYNFLTR